MTKLSDTRSILVLTLAALVGASGWFFYFFSRDDGHAHGPAVASAATTPAASTHDGVEKWTCGMHPHIVSDEPGQCPICGMDLVPMNAGGNEEGVVKIDPVTMQNIGVRTALVERAALGRSVRTTGRFEANEQLATAVSPKVGGWIETLHVDYTGARVRKGQPLLEIYSPELVSTQEEYLLALRNLERLAGTPAEADARRLAEAARRRLAYWDVTAEQIRRLEETRTPQKTVTLHAPAAGTVTATNVVEGQQVTPGQTLMRLTDLSRVWLMVDVYEKDLAWVRPGTEARVALPYDPGRELTGSIDYVYDELDPEARTARARVTLPNPGLALKPGMYATVVLESAGAEPGLVIPAEAVLQSADRSVVLLAVPDETGQGLSGRFRPVEVTTGLQTDGRVQITDGLREGQRVVTSAQFLIDSEARLQSAVAAMTGGHQQGAAPAGEPPALPGTIDAEHKAMRVDVHAADADGDGHVYQCLDQPHLLRDGEGPVAGCTDTARRVSVGAAQAVLHGAGYTNVPVDPARADRDGDGFVYQSPMHFSIIEDGPGRCEICNMELERVSIEQARRTLREEGYRTAADPH